MNSITQRKEKIPGPTTHCRIWPSLILSSSPLCSSHTVAWIEQALSCLRTVALTVHSPEMLCLQICTWLTCSFLRTLLNCPLKGSPSSTSIIFFITQIVSFITHFFIIKHSKHNNTKSDTKCNPHIISLPSFLCFIGCGVPYNTHNNKSNDNRGDNT